MQQYPFRNPRLLESLYAPDQLVTAGPGRRFAGYLIDILIPIVLYFLIIPTMFAASASTSDDDGSSAAAGALMLIFLGLSGAWVVWWILVAKNGQSPAKQLLGMYVMNQDGTRAGFGTMILRELVIKFLLGGFLSVITFGIYWVVAPIWCLWDRDRQCVWDKIGSTYVAFSGNGFKPLTRPEMFMRGELPPLHRATQAANVVP